MKNGADNKPVVLAAEDGSRSKSLLRSVARWLATAAVVISPWMFAGSDAWAYLVICLLAGVAVGVWLLSVACFPGGRFRGCAAGVFLLLLAAFVTLQSASLPAGLVETLNPLPGRIHAEYRATMVRAEDLKHMERFASDESRPRASLSVSASGTIRSLSLFVAYAGIFLVMANTVRRWRHVKHVGTAIVISCFILAVVSIVHKFSGSRLLLWFYEPRYGGTFFGTFTNRNHFALFMNMAAGLALGMFLASSKLRETLEWPDWRSRLIWFSSTRASRVALLAFAVIIMVGAVFMSVSRGGIVSLTAAAGVTGVFFARNRTADRLPLYIFGLVLLAVAVITWLGWEPVVSRFAALGRTIRDPQSDFRTGAMADTLTLFGACPVFGCGFGAFRFIYPMFQSSPVNAYRWIHAHSDWMQLLAEGGIIGAALFLLAVGMCLREIRGHWDVALVRTRLFLAGVAVGIGAAAIHSFIDYGMHRPSNAFLLSALAGLAVAVVHLHPKDEGCAPEAIRKKSRSVIVGPLGRIAAIVAMVLLTALHFVEIKDLRGELAYARFMYFRSAADKCANPDDFASMVSSAMQEMDVVAGSDSGDADALREITANAFVWLSDRTLDRQIRAALAMKVSDTAAMSVSAAPSDYLSWLWLGRSRLVLGRWEEGSNCGKRANELINPANSVRLTNIRDNKK